MKYVHRLLSAFISRIWLQVKILTESMNLSVNHIQNENTDENTAGSGLSGRRESKIVHGSVAPP